MRGPLNVKHVLGKNETYFMSLIFSLSLWIDKMTWTHAITYLESRWMDFDTVLCLSS